MESRSDSTWLPIWYRFRRDRLALGGGAFITRLLLIAILAPLLPIRNPNHGYYELLPADGRPLAPGSAFLLGSDAIGRDLLSRIIWGARVSLFIGFVANGLAVIVGLCVGIVAGYSVRKTDAKRGGGLLYFPVGFLFQAPRNQDPTLPPSGRRRRSTSGSAKRLLLKW